MLSGLPQPQHPGFGQNKMGPMQQVAPPGAMQMEKPKAPDLSDQVPICLDYPAGDESKRCLSIKPPGCDKPMGAAIADGKVVSAIIAKFSHSAFPLCARDILRFVGDGRIRARVELRAMWLKLTKDEPSFPGDDERSVASIMLWYSGDVKLKDTFIDVRFLLGDTNSGEEISFDDFAEIVTKMAMPEDIRRQLEEKDEKDWEDDEEHGQQRRASRMRAVGLVLHEETSAFFALAESMRPTLEELNMKLREAAEKDGRMSEERKRDMLEKAREKGNE